MAQPFSFARLKVGDVFEMDFAGKRTRWKVLGRCPTTGMTKAMQVYPDQLHHYGLHFADWGDLHRNPRLYQPANTISVVVHKPRHWLVRWTLWWWLGTTYSVIEEQVQGDEDRKKRLKECGWED